jgi:tetratricopeptide (TPR) repeat protein
MSQLQEMLIDWAKKGKRWPLLPLLLGIPAAFYFIQAYFALSFRGTLTHPLFWVATGVLAILAGALYWAVFPRAKLRLLAGGILALVGVGFLAGGFRRSTRPPLPEDRLVVAIARFSPVSPGANEEADNIPHRIGQRLQERQNQGAPLEIRLLSESVAGDDEGERRKAANALCTSRRVKAHVILWGEVRKDEGELYVKPRLTVGRQPLQAHIQEPSLGEFVSREPRQLEFKERLSKDIADVVGLVYGIAWCKVGRWDRALRILDDVKSNEGYLYKGLCLTQRAQSVANPRQDLEGALTAYEKIIGQPRLWKLTAWTDELTWAAYLNRANAIAARALSSPPEQSTAFLREAIEAYRAALQVHTRAELPQDWARTQNNLGNALRELGTRAGGEEGNKLLREAVEAFRAALQVHTQAELPQGWAATQNSLGNALVELGTRAGGEEGNKLLREAVEAYRAALQVATRAELPQGWAATQNGLGSALRELGTRTGGEEGNKLLREAVEAFRAALQVYTRAELPQGWAGTQNNLGNALGELGGRAGGEEGNKLVQEAVEAYRAALQVRTRAELPQDWAMTQNNLGHALVELGGRAGGEEGNKLVREAVEAFRAALQVYTRAELPQGWAGTQNNLGNALGDLGARVQRQGRNEVPKERCRLLR